MYNQIMRKEYTHKHYGGLKERQDSLLFNHLRIMCNLQFHGSKVWTSYSRVPPECDIAQRVWQLLNAFCVSFCWMSRVLGISSSKTVASMESAIAVGHRARKGPLQAGSIRAADSNDRRTWTTFIHVSLSLMQMCLSTKLISNINSLSQNFSHTKQAA